MTHNIIFSIFIDIPEDKLDNPGWYENGVQVKTDKSLNTKNALYNNRHELEKRQRDYAATLHNPRAGETCEYRLLGNDKHYKDFLMILQNGARTFLLHNIILVFATLHLSIGTHMLCCLKMDSTQKTTCSILVSWWQDITSYKNLDTFMNSIRL